MTVRNRRGALLAWVGLLLAMGPARAETLQPGFWKVTSTPVVNGAPAPPQVKLRCVTPAEAADIDKTFSPEARSQGATCERVEHEVTATTLKWRLRCTGPMTMDVAGAFRFDTPQHYTALVTTSGSIGGQTINSHVNIEGERTGECP